jgi:hypothetical protein
MKIKKNLPIIILLVSAFIFNTISAQQNSGGMPVSFQNETFFNQMKTNLNSIVLPNISNEAEQQRADSIAALTCTTCDNQFYGSGVDITVDIKTYGSLKILKDSSKLWLLKIESSTAYGLQFYYDKFKIPFGAKMFIFNEERTMVLGAFTASNNPKNEDNLIKFGTEPIHGKNIIIEYHEPLNPEFEGEISITKVIHIFNKYGPWSVYGGAGECNKNVSCPEGVGWEKEINSVVLILGYNSANNFAAQCSGALMNNTNIPKKALLLSANHCIDDVNNTGDTKFDYRSWMFLFNHQTSGCNDDCYNVTAYHGQSKYGSTYLVSDETCSPRSDYLLLDIEMT